MKTGAKLSLFFLLLSTLSSNAKEVFQVKYKSAGLEWSQFINKSTSNGCTTIRNCTIEGEDGGAINLINLKKADVGIVLTGKHHEMHIIENNNGRKPLHIQHDDDEQRWYKVYAPHSEAEKECQTLDRSSRLPSAKEVAEMQLSLRDNDPDYWGETNDFWDKADPGTATRSIWTSTIAAGREAQAIIMTSAGNGVFGGSESRHMPPRHYIGIRCVRESL